MLWTLTLPFLLNLSACIQNNATATEEAAAYIPQESIRPTEVAIAIAEKKTFHSFVYGNGKIIPDFEQMIRAERAGMVKYCKAYDGLRVAKNELILQLETADIDLRIEQNRLAHFNATVEYESRLLGYEEMLVGKTAAEAAHIRKKLQIETKVLTTELEWRALQLELKKQSLLAPVAGMLADVKIKEGMQLRAGQELFRLYSADVLYLDIKVLESDLLLIHKGQLASIELLASPNRKLTAKVAAINPWLEEGGYGKVRLQLNQTKGLIPGMHAKATIAIKEKKSLIVPKEALVMRSGKQVVFSVEEGSAKWNEVKVGRDNGAEVEIINGLEAGSFVIVSNNLQLAHDAPVAPITSTVLNQ